jgi:hypothetical protein
LQNGSRNRLIGKSHEGQQCKQGGWQWPGGKLIAVIFNICLEAWSDGKAPGISPMGNPLPAGALATMAISWASYGVKRARAGGAGNPAVIDVTVHAHIFGHPRGVHYFEQIVAHAMASTDVWVATRLEIAEFMLQQSA